jgi:hypothetical protein
MLEKCGETETQFGGVNAKLYSHFERQFNGNLIKLNILLKTYITKQPAYRYLQQFYS